MKGAKRGRPRKQPEPEESEPGVKWQKLPGGRSGAGATAAAQDDDSHASGPAFTGGRAPPANGRKSRAAPHAATAAAAAAMISQQANAKRPPGRPRKHPIPSQPPPAPAPAAPSSADGSPWNQLHLLAPQSSGDEDSPQVADSRDSSHGTPAGAGSLMRREDSCAGTAVSGDLGSGLQSILGGGGVERLRKGRSRKASAPRRRAIPGCVLSSCWDAMRHAHALQAIDILPWTTQSCACSNVSF